MLATCPAPAPSLPGPPRAGRHVALLALGLLGYGCAEPGTLCVRDAQCPQGQVCGDGVCSPRGLTDGAAGEGTPGGPDSAPDTWRPDYTLARQDGQGACTPDNDGQVARDELLFAVPSAVRVTLGTGLTLDLQGVQRGGVTYWDLNPGAADDHAVQMAVQAVPAWTAASFPQATYASQLTADFGTFTRVDLLGVFQVTATALQLQGAVSDKANHTRVTYDRPLVALRFPVRVGDSYSSQAAMSGFTDYAVPVMNTERYEVQVLQRGRLRLLFGLTIDALLVRVRQQLTPTLNPLLKSRTTVFFFVAECYGIVARVVAAADPGAALAAVKAEQRWKLASP